MLPHKLQQIPGVMVGGIGWQGIVPSRAAKMGSLAVDSGIAKIGRPSEFFEQLEPDKIAEQIIVSARQELPAIVEGIMAREQPRLWQELPPPIKEMIEGRVLAQLPEVVHELTDEIGAHIEQLVDVKLMVIKRFDPELANRVFLDMGQRELTFIKNFGFVFGFALGIPVAVLTHFVTFWWLLPILGVVIGYVTNWVALWMIYEPPEPQRWGPLRVHGLFIRRQHDVAEVYATIVADEILTVSEFGSELLTGPQSDRTRALVEDALRPAIDRAVGPARARGAGRPRRRPLRIDSPVVRHRADRSDDGAAQRPVLQPGAVGHDAQAHHRSHTRDVRPRTSASCCARPPERTSGSCSSTARCWDWPAG